MKKMSASEFMRKVAQNVTPILYPPEKKINRYMIPVQDSSNEEMDKSPLPLSVIPNYMGINLCSVEHVDWEEMPDGQLVNFGIHFDPDMTNYSVPDGDIDSGDYVIDSDNKIKEDMKMKKMSASDFMRKVAAGLTDEEEDLFSYPEENKQKVSPDKPVKLPPVKPPVTKSEPKQSKESPIQMTPERIVELESDKERMDRNRQTIMDLFGGDPMMLNDLEEGVERDSRTGVPVASGTERAPSMQQAWEDSGVFPAMNNQTADFLASIMQKKSSANLSASAFMRKVAGDPFAELDTEVAKLDKKQMAKEQAESSARAEVMMGQKKKTPESAKKEETPLGGKGSVNRNLTRSKEKFLPKTNSANLSASEYVRKLAGDIESIKVKKETMWDDPEDEGKAYLEKQRGLGLGEPTDGKCRVTGKAVEHRGRKSSASNLSASEYIRKLSKSNNIKEEVISGDKAKEPVLASAEKEPDKGMFVGDNNPFRLYDED